MENENKKITLRKCFSKVKSPTVLVRAVLSLDEIKGDVQGTGTSHQGTAKTGTRKTGVSFGGFKPPNQYYIGAMKMRIFMFF